jgi:hypothetical protein
MLFLNFEQLYSYYIMHPKGYPPEDDHVHY